MGSLLALSAGERMGCNELAGRVGLSPSRASRVIGRLIDKGYLFRAENGRDRRCIFLSLTARGEECRRQILQAEEACARRILSRLSADQARKVEEGIEILLEVL
jgi:DNA-binding MarR family transcriptional regulator